MRFMLCVFVLSSIVSIGFGIRCFSCRSDLDPKCGDPFDNSTIAVTDCVRDASLENRRVNACQKIKQKVNGKWYVVRGCGYVFDSNGLQDDERVCFTKTGKDSVYTEYCNCNSKDGCNSSFTFKPTSLLFALMALPSLVVKMLS